MSAARKPAGRDALRPLVIGHRGAPGYLPDHTLEGYALAIEQGADYVEPDVVATKDGHLIARHDVNLAFTTDVAAHPEFASRHRTVVVDGVEETGWFASDFTLAEVKTLRALQPRRERPQEYNALYEIPTLGEVLALASRAGANRNRPVGIYAELKHPTYHAGLGLALEEPLVAALRDAGLDSADAPVFIESFEQASLRRMSSMTAIRLVQLVDANGIDAAGRPTYAAPHDRPFDWTAAGERRRTFDALTTDAGLKEVAEYAVGIAPWKVYVQSIAIDGTNGSARRALPPTTLVERAHAAGLLVHTWTFSSEPHRVAHDESDPLNDYTRYFEIGVDGVFSDFPDTAAAARDAFVGSDRGARRAS